MLRWNVICCYGVNDLLCILTLIRPSFILLMRAHCIRRLHFNSIPFFFHELWQLLLDVFEEDGDTS